MKVVLCDLPTSNGEAVAKALGENATFIPVDIRSPEDVKAALNQTKEKYNKLNVLVNCAGVTYAHETKSKSREIGFDMERFCNTLDVCVLLRCSSQK